MGLRETNLQKMGDRAFDALVVGGGINGAVSAAALAARGVSTAIIDRGDWGGGTSQESSNLIWGGIKYLENYELGLVWDLCKSRNQLMEAYPSNVREIRFFSAVRPGFRWHPLFMLGGTWAYWLFGRGYTQAPRYLSRKRIDSEMPVVDARQFKGGVEYSDAYLVDNDSRFVFNFVRSALNFGAIAANYVELLEARRVPSGGWESRVRCMETGAEKTVHSQVVINAAGPYADDVVGRAHTQTEHRHVFAKGIHLLVDRVTPEEKVLTFFDENGRMFFVIPMGPRSVIGTTDTRVKQPDTRVTEEDRDFLFRNINACLRLNLGPEAIIAERCGVRPLVVKGGDFQDDDGQWFNLSRKHVLEAGDGIVSMYGGKLTDCINIGEEVARLVRNMGVRVVEDGDTRRWYGEPPEEIRKEFFRQAHLMRLDELREQTTHELLSTRLWRRYGLRAFTMLEAIRREPAMDDVLIENAQYIRCELHHAAMTEMVTRLDDFMRRRSKIALVVPHEQLQEQVGVMEACRILFGGDAERRYRQYFESHENGYVESLGSTAA